MPTIEASQLRAAAQRARQHTAKTDREMLRDARETRANSFDVFLSHSHVDRDLVIGAKQVFEEAGLSVYVDWLEDGEIGRAAVDKVRAAMLRKRMEQSEAMFYAHTPNAALSRWCPWELGYFDALKKPDERVFVMAVTEAGETYSGQEYLGLYQTVDPRQYRRPTRRRSSDSERLERRLLADQFGLRTPRFYF